MNIFSEEDKKMGQKIHEKMLNITNHQGNANQNHSITSYMLELSKRQVVSGNWCCKDVEKRKPLCAVGENVNWYSYHGKKKESSPKN